MGLFHRKIKNGIAGTAYVSSATGVPPSMQASINIGSFYTCGVRLVVTVPGREPYAVSKDVNADPNRPVEGGMTLPVVVDPNDPEHLQLDLKGIPKPGEALDAQQQADLEAIRAGRPPGGGNSSILEESQQLEAQSEHLRDQAQHFMESMVAKRAAAERAANGGNVPTQTLAKLDEGLAKGLITQEVHDDLRARVISGEL